MFGVGVDMLIVGMPRIEMTQQQVMFSLQSSPKTGYNPM
jgi:hypothetical protein